MLLEQLLEKKDVELYIKLRADFLREIKHRETIKEPLENREFVRKRFEGRIEELTKLLHIIKNGQVKNMSKSYFHKLERLTHENSACTKSPTPHYKCGACANTTGRLAPMPVALYPPLFN